MTPETGNIEVLPSRSDERAARHSPVHAPLWLLALVTFGGTLAIHIFVPALPLAAKDLATDSAAIRASISAYILGLGIGQLIYGPLSDRYGRRPTLLAGMALYAASGLAVALSPNVHSLVLARWFQALGGCSGLVLARSIVRDTAGPVEATRRLALMNLMVMLGPSVAPLLGSVLAAWLGWRAIPFFLFGLGVVGFFLSWRMLPETNPRTVAVNVAALLDDYRRLLKSPAFVGYAVGGGCATTSIYAFVASAPFIFVDRIHRPSGEVGVYLALLISGVWLGSVLIVRLIKVLALERLLLIANGLSILGAGGLLLAVMTDHLGIGSVIGSMFVFAIGAGMSSPIALTKAISVNPNVIGLASGVYGFTQMILGALCTELSGRGADPALSAAIVLVGATVLAQFAFRIASRSRAG